MYIYIQYVYSFFLSPQIKNVPYYRGKIYIYSRARYGCEQVDYTVVYFLKMEWSFKPMKK